MIPGRHFVLDRIIGNHAKVQTVLASSGPFSRQFSIRFIPEQRVQWLSLA